MMDKVSFERSLEDPIAFWGSRTREEIEKRLGVNVADMVGFEQRNPHHCHDLFWHTLHTVAGLDNGASDAVRVAAFFHDIGKPQSAKKKGDTLVFYGHAKRSVHLAMPLLRNLGYSDEDIERICFYIGHHDDFISWVLPTEAYDRTNTHLIEITPENLKKYIERTVLDNPFLQRENIKEIWLDLLRLCCADVSAQAETVFRNGVAVDSKDHKLNKLYAVETVLTSLAFD